MVRLDDSLKEHLETAIWLLCRRPMVTPNYKGGQKDDIIWAGRYLKKSLEEGNINEEEENSYWGTAKFSHENYYWPQNFGKY